MKNKILSLLSKFKSMRKRNRVVAVILLIGSTLWFCLPEYNQMKIKKYFGSEDAEYYFERRASEYINKSCSGYNFSRRDAGLGINLYLDIGNSSSIKQLLTLAWLGYADSRCMDDSQKFFRYDIDWELKDKYSQDYRQLEKLIIDKEDFSSFYKNTYYDNPYLILLRFYIRNSKSDAERFFSKIVDVCYTSNRENCLFNVVRFMDNLDLRDRDIVGGKININSLGIEFSTKLIEMTVGEENLEARYLLAKFMLSKNSDDQEAFAIIKELAEKKRYAKALIFQGHNAWFGRKDKDLAEEYFIQASVVAEVKHNDDLTNAYLKLKNLPGYEKYALLQSKIERYIGERHTFKHSDIQSSSERLADFYLEDKEYDKAKEIYEKIIAYYKSVHSFSKLGDIYYQGLGLRQDLKKASEYYGLACDFKDQDACDKFREVNEKIRN